MLTRRFIAVSRLCSTILIGVTLLTGQFALAQDNSQGRYRPDGRQLAQGVARELGEQLYEVRTYDPEPQVAEFSAATIFYPLTLSFAPPIGAAVLVPGYRGTAEDYSWWGPMLASFGYAVMIIDTNTVEDNLEARKQALLAAVDFIKNENNDPDSPIQGRIDTGKIAIMGHSLGGGAALQAARELGDDLGAVIPLLPYCCELGQSFSGDLAGLSAPLLIMATAEDTVAPPATHARLLYDTADGAASRVYMEFATGNHMMANNTGQELAAMGRYAMAFLKFHLDAQPRYEAVIYGDQEAPFADKFSRYDTSR
ncbi:MAG: hypothetical protein R3F41_01715 [Gammaproteobacteria bacterium]|nr:hypothetical protein [Pseudomonadales bacterium]